jgi:hypothetical protein
MAKGGRQDALDFPLLLRRNVVIEKNYQRNRAKFPVEELREYVGQWVAFSPDGSRIIAGAPSIAELDPLISAAGEDPEDVPLERIEIGESILGGAEFL